MLTVSPGPEYVKWVAYLEPGFDEVGIQTFRYPAELNKFIKRVNSTPEGFVSFGSSDSPQTALDALNWWLDDPRAHKTHGWSFYISLEQVKRHPLPGGRQWATGPRAARNPNDRLFKKLDFEFDVPKRKNTDDPL